MSTKYGKEYELRAMVLLHSAQLDELETFLEQFKDEFWDTAEFQLLEAIQMYDSAVRNGTNDWAGLQENFRQKMEVLDPRSPITRFYFLNYQFLCGRNADAEDNVMSGLLIEMLRKLQQIDNPPRCLLLGFMAFNASRWFQKQGNTITALQWYSRASNHRKEWFHTVKTMGHCRKIVAAAAEQIRKIHEAFPNFFPDKDIACLGISDTLLEEVTAIATGDRSVTFTPT